MVKLRHPLKWHGGKQPLASKIVSLFPPHVHYVEPFAGGLGVLLSRDPEGVSEVANDIDSELMNFWRVLAHEDLFPQFKRVCEATPFGEAAFSQALDGQGVYTSNVARAWSFFTLVRQSLAARKDSFAPLSRTRIRRGMNEQASAWITAVDGLAEVHARLRRVVLLNRPALEVVRSQDGPATLFYCDPPYPHETRTAPNVYRHEMSATDHVLFLGAMKKITGKAMISGYACSMYDDALKGWARHTFDVANHAAGGESKGRETEVVWCNFGFN